MKQNWIEQLKEYCKPKVFCGGDHCSGLWNIECDDPIHYQDNPEQLVPIYKIKHFIQTVVIPEELERAFRVTDNEELKDLIA